MSETRAEMEGEGSKRLAFGDSIRELHEPIEVQFKLDKVNLLEN